MLQGCQGPTGLDFPLLVELSESLGDLRAHGCGAFRGGHFQEHVDQVGGQGACLVKR